MLVYPSSAPHHFIRARTEMQPIIRFIASMTKFVFSFVSTDLYRLGFL
jgi:hypothetical protein